MKIADARLEHWMREFYFETDIDIGSSGVQSYSLKEIRQLLRITEAELDGIVFDDSRTTGDPALREAISRRWAGGEADKVMATNGSSEAIFLIMAALLQYRDEVIVLDPCYQQLYSIAESLGCRLKRWMLRFDSRFVADIEEVKSLINRETRMIVVNFPHNPTGSSLNRDQFEALVEIAHQAGIYLVWDGAFSDMTYEEPPLPDPTVFYEKAISIGTLSKSYGLPGLRVGWCIASTEIQNQFVRMRDYTTLHLSPLVELIARRVIENADKVLEAKLRHAQSNLRVLSSWMEEHKTVVDWIRPRGGVCVFPRLIGVRDTEDLCRKLAVENRVLLVPGNCFNKSEHVRLGFGGASEELKKGLSCLSAALQSKTFLSKIT